MEGGRERERRKDVEGGEKARAWTKSKEGESGREVINQEEERRCTTMDHVMMHCVGYMCGSHDVLCGYICGSHVHCVRYMCGSHDALCGVHVWIT